MLEKMTERPADGFIVDLEDAVGPPHKSDARRLLSRGWPFGLAPEKAWLRINASHDKDAFAADLELAETIQPAWLVLPKAEELQVVERLCKVQSKWNGRVGLMIETAAGVTRVRELAAVAPEVGALIVGSADLRRSLHARPDGERVWEHHALAEILLAARVHGLLAIDSVYFRLHDVPGLERHATLARQLGYDGKSCIHPDQIETIHRVFAPTREERHWAARVIEEWERQDGERQGVVVVDDEMIEALHLALARAILSRAGLEEGSE